MSTFQVLARKWRPQRFDDVIGQRGVTQTLRNAIAANRIAQSFVFAGPRGVGKTTTARILARGLNCIQGPTADPCGVCDACVEIAQGRDIDVLEIDAATNTQVDKVRDIIITGLGIAPVRDRYKIFIIDEVHRLSQQAFDALLKSIEEPPPHVVFMMATTEIEKVPPTIQSRSQVFELKTIGVKQIADQLQKIADAEHITIDDGALTLLARAGDGSMRDAQSAFDQIIAFAGTTISADDVTTVLGLVRRDLLMDIAEAVAREDGAAVFELAARAVESGYDMRHVIRELARLNRDLLLVGLDPSRPRRSGDRRRGRARADPEPGQPVLERGSDARLRRADEGRLRHPRVDAASLPSRIGVAALGPPAPARAAERHDSGAGEGCARQRLVPARPRPRAARPPGIPLGATSGHQACAVECRHGARGRDEARRGHGRESGDRRRRVIGAGQASNVAVPVMPATAPAAEPVAVPAAPSAPGPGDAGLKEALLAELQKTKKFFYGTVIAQAQRIDVEADRVVMTFAPQHRALKQQLEQSRPWLEEMATRLAGRKMIVSGVDGTGPAPGKPGDAARAAAGGDQQSALKQKAMADSGVQALLDVFRTDIKEVEEI